MKFGRQGVLILLLLGGAALALAIISPMFFGGPEALTEDGKQGPAWFLASKGLIESEQDVTIASQITGLVRELKADEGERVSSGQEILRFENAKIRARLELAEASLKQSEAIFLKLERGYRKEDIDAARLAYEKARAVAQDNQKELSRSENLLKTGAITRNTFDKVKLDFDVAQASMNEAKVNLNKLSQGPRAEEINEAKAAMDMAKAEVHFIQATLQDYSISSPFDGLVIMRHTSIGETVDVGTPLFTIINPDNLRVWAEVEETDAGKVSVGHPVTVKVDALHEKIFRGKVSKVIKAVQRKRQKSFDPVASFDINTQKILVELNDYSGLLHGLTVTVFFDK